MDKEQDWQKLAQQICDETDPAKVVVLAKELVEKLDGVWQPENRPLFRDNYKALLMPSRRTKE